MCLKFLFFFWNRKEQEERKAKRSGKTASINVYIHHKYLIDNVITNYKFISFPPPPPPTSFVSATLLIFVFFFFFFSAMKSKQTEDLQLSPFSLQKKNVSGRSFTIIIKTNVYQSKNSLLKYKGSKNIYNIDFTI